MSKYKTGDKFEIEIKEVVVSECGKALYAVEDVPILILDDYILNRLKQVKTEEVETEPDWTKVKQRRTAVANGLFCRLQRWKGERLVWW